jgi:flagellar biosynthetic protein FliO
MKSRITTLVVLAALAAPPVAAQGPAPAPAAPDEAAAPAAPDEAPATAEADEAPAPAEAAPGSPRAPADVDALAAELLEQARTTRRRAPGEATPSGPPADPASAGLPLALGGLAVGLAIFAAAWAVRRARAGGPLAADGRALEVLESTWIGRGQRLVLVAVEGRRVLLGVTPGGISSLATFEGERATNLPRTAGNVKRMLERAAADDTDFAAMVKDELAESARPRREDRRRSLEEIGRL